MILHVSVCDHAMAAATPLHSTLELFNNCNFS